MVKAGTKPPVSTKLVPLLTAVKLPVQPAGEMLVVALALIRPVLGVVG